MLRPRVWVKKEKKMCYDLWRLVWGDDGELCEVWANDRTCYQPDEVVLLKLIGKLDKNGKEIYEKDIVRNLDREEELIGKVIWDVDGFIVRLPKFMETEEGIKSNYMHLGSNDWEIIGNTLQHPNLLGKPESEPGRKG